MTQTEKTEPTLKEIKMAAAFSHGDKEIESILLSFWCKSDLFAASNGDEAASDAALVKFVLAREGEALARVMDKVEARKRGIVSRSELFMSPQKKLIRRIMKYELSWVLAEILAEATKAKESE